MQVMFPNLSSGRLPKESHSEGQIFREKSTATSTKCLNILVSCTSWEKTERNWKKQAPGLGIYLTNVLSEQKPRGSVQILAAGILQSATKHSHCIVPSVFCHLRSLENSVWVILHEQLRCLIQLDGVGVHHLDSDFLAQSNDFGCASSASQATRAAFPLSCFQVPGRAAQAGHTAMALNCCWICACCPSNPAVASSCATKTTKGTSDWLLSAAAATTGAAKAQQKQLNYEITIQNLFSCFLTRAKLQ